ncbi:unnamed protein product [Coffea canephora]|uniref:Uncharacterized protein n=1 Tax=Coffea canephora TaxID=49390 RepID=A0A068TN90_COFCA|nr:unnamed protein product [Coffea canephora]
MPLLASASLSWPSGFTSSAKLLTTRSTPLLILTLTPHPLLPVLILTENSQCERLFSFESCACR